jgi:lactoylglutathione lyase
MVAFLVHARAKVNEAYQLALKHGGSSEGAPGLRPEYHEHYYAAYFKDPEGNKLCVVCHDAEA